MLEVGVVRLAQGQAVGEPAEQGARRPDLLRMLLDQRDVDRRKVGRLEHAGEHATGVRTEWSSRCQEDDVNPVLLQEPGHLRSGVAFEDVPGPQGAHERVEALGQAADGAAL